MRRAGWGVPQDVAEVDKAMADLSSGQAPPVVIVGSGPDALHAAAVVVEAGVRVELLLRGTLDDAVLAAALAWSVQRWRGLSTGVPTAVEGSGLLSTAGLVSLPMGARDLARVLPPSVRAPAVRRLARARARNAVAELVGGGQEERSYSDWVQRRFGRPLLDELFAPYARARWGRSPDALSASTARQHHGIPDDRAVTEPTRDPGQRWRETLTAAGVVVRENVDVSAILVEDGRVSGLRLADDTVRGVGAGLWTTESPAVVARWLGEACPVEASGPAVGLEAHDAVRVHLPGASVHKPQTTVHIALPDTPVWRLEQGVSVAGWVLSATLPLGASAAPSAEALVTSVAEKVSMDGTSGAQAVRVLGWEPAWSPGCHARLRRVLDVWDGLGIVAIGRGGLYHSADPPVLQAHILALLQPDREPLWDLVRRFAEPPVRAEDLAVPITRFVER